jgi:uncharacterized surface protein with fasciclin (FAS1) repeats
LANSNFDFVKLLNSTSSTSPITLFAPVNSAIARFASNAPVSALLNANLFYPTTGNTTLFEIFVANHFLPNTNANSTVISQLLAASNDSHHLVLDFTFGKTQVVTLAGLNITVRGIVQTGNTLPVPPLIFVQNALVVKPDAIIAANGVVHLISNIIDPFIDATGGFFGPTTEVVQGVETTFGPIIKMALSLLNV